MSAESGISTFRDADGLWEGHDVMSVASPQGFERDPDLVLDFYNQRRRQLFEVTPNVGHRSLVELEKDHEVVVVTQNVDDLHERAGSKNVIHLHGELRKVRSTGDPAFVKFHENDILLGDLCPSGYQLRPHIVWFGEAVPAMEEAIEEVMSADLFLIVGTSLQVYPAASLLAFAPEYCKMYYIDPRPHLSYEVRSRDIHIIEATAANGLPDLVNEINKKR